MLVSSDANAAQSRAPGESTRFYDDLGCLAAGSTSQAEGTVRWVRLASGGWASTESAWFAVTGMRTPMDYGIVAFESRDQAQASDREGEPRRWAAVIRHVEER
jgi:hypothetical protein